MLARPDVQRLPWNTIAVVVASAVVIAWTVGFVIGLIVNFFSLD